MTHAEIDRTLAKFMGCALEPPESDPAGPPMIWHPFSPRTDRNHLGKLLVKLTLWQKAEAMTRLHRIWFSGWSRDEEAFWLLTCDPAIIAGAVAKVVANE